MGPANQGLDREDLTRLEVELRLVVQDEVALFHRDAQFVEQVRLVLAAVDVLVVEDIGHIAQLCSVHRHVGAPYERRPVRSRWRHERNADTGARRCA